MGKQVFEMGDLFCNLLMFFFDLPTFECGQPAQLHIQNGLRLELAQFEAMRPNLFWQHQHPADSRMVLMTASRLCQRNQIAIQDVLASTGFGQFKIRTADDDHLAMLDENLQGTLERQRARFAIHQAQAIARQRWIARPYIYKAGSKPSWAVRHA